MLRENYVAKRTELMEEAQNFINEGNFEAFEAKKVEVEKLDADFDVACQKQAELDVLNSRKEVAKEREEPICTGVSSANAKNKYSKL